MSHPFRVRLTHLGPIKVSHAVRHLNLTPMDYIRASRIYGEWDLWGFIITHKSEWGFMARLRILFVPINPHKSP